jgi:hypothetical protein
MRPSAVIAVRNRASETQAIAHIGTTIEIPTGENYKKVRAMADEHYDGIIKKAVLAVAAAGPLVLAPIPGPADVAMGLLTGSCW